jgi:hypothetical protein
LGIEALGLKVSIKGRKEGAIDVICLKAYEGARICRKIIEMASEWNEMIYKIWLG